MGIFNFFTIRKRKKALEKQKAELLKQAGSKGLTLYRYDKKANRLSVASEYTDDKEPGNIVYLVALNYKNALRKLRKLGY